MVLSQNFSRLFSDFGTRHGEKRLSPRVTSRESDIFIRRSGREIGFASPSQPKVIDSCRFDLLFRQNH
jgi:hypothetical protein